MSETWLMADAGLLQYLLAFNLLGSNWSYRVSEKGETFREVEMAGERMAEDGLC